MPQFEKHFSVEEANDLLPELRRLLAGIQKVRDSLVVEWERAQPVLKAAGSNGGGKEASGNYMIDNTRLVSEFGVQYRPYRDRVLQIINDIRRDNRLPPIG